MTLKEQIESFDDWDDDLYEDERGSIEYDNMDDHESEDGYDYDDVPDHEDEAIEARGWTQRDMDEVENWWNGFQDDIEESNEEDRAANEWLGENETIASLNAKEAKLQEALKAVQVAKAKLTK